MRSPFQFYPSECDRFNGWPKDVCCFENVQKDHLKKLQENVSMVQLYGNKNCGKGKFCYELTGNSKLGFYGFGECVDDGENRLKAKCQCGDEL